LIRHEGGEDDDERLATLRTQLEKEILESSCGALKGSGFTPNIAEVIMDEITLLIHLKVPALSVTITITITITIDSF
jgi:hypothetical protein